MTELVRIVSDHIEYHYSQDAASQMIIDKARLEGKLLSLPVTSIPLRASLCKGLDFLKF